MKKKVKCLYCPAEWECDMHESLKDLNLTTVCGECYFKHPHKPVKNLLDVIEDLNQMEKKANEKISR